MDISGSWMKMTDTECSAKYPGIITYYENGIYQAEASAGSSQHPVWDTGTFRLNKNTISMSTSNDAVIEYAISYENETLVFEDPGGCVTTYARQDVNA